MFFFDAIDNRKRTTTTIYYADSDNSNSCFEMVLETAKNKQKYMFMII